MLTKCARLFPLRSKDLITPLPWSPFPAGEGKRAIPNLFAFQRTSFHFYPYKEKWNIVLESICTHNRVITNFFNKIFLFAMQNYILDDIRCTNTIRSLSTLPSPAGKGDRGSGVMRSLLRKGKRRKYCVSTKRKYELCFYW